MAPDRNNGRKVPWGKNPRRTVELLSLISKKHRYVEAFFPQHITEEQGQWVTRRDCCIEFLKDDPYMLEKAEEGLVRRRNGKWIPTEEWTSSVYDPITARVEFLKERMANEWYRKKFSMLTYWSCWDDVPSKIVDNDAEIKKKHNTLRKKHSYYFLLRKLWLRTQIRPQVAIADNISPPTTPARPNPLQQNERPTNTYSATLVEDSSDGEDITFVAQYQRRPSSSSGGSSNGKSRKTRRDSPEVQFIG